MTLSLFDRSVDLRANTLDLLTGVLAVLLFDLADNIALKIYTRHACSQLLEVRNGVAVVVQHLITLLIEVVPLGIHALELVQNILGNTDL